MEPKTGMRNVPAIVEQHCKMNTLKYFPQERGILYFHEVEDNGLKLHIPY